MYRNPGGQQAFGKPIRRQSLHLPEEPSLRIWRLFILVKVTEEHYALVRSNFQ